MITSFTYKPNLQNTFILFQSQESLQLQGQPPAPPSSLLPNGNTPADLPSKKKYPKDDYQKNITINVVKCCIREMLSARYRRLIDRRCCKLRVSYEEVGKLVEPILKEVVISLGDLRKLLTTGSEEEMKAKKVFAWFLEWYLRHRYMHYLLAEGKMNFKERYIEYKNKYMLYLLHSIRHDAPQEPPSTLNISPL